MESLLNRFFKSAVLQSFFLFILGVFLFVESEATIMTISYVIGGLLIALGTMAIIRFVQSNSEAHSELDILYGIFTGILGLLIINNPKALASLLPIVLGIMIIITSATKIAYAFELKDDGNDLWKSTMIVSLISVMCGVFLIFNPFKGAKIIMQIIGGFIAVYAILDLVSTVTIRHNVKKIKKEVTKTITDAMVIIEEDADKIEVEKSKSKKKTK